MHPILFKLGPVTVYSYGTLVALAFLISTYLAIKELNKNPIINPNQAMDLALYGLVSGIVGARLLHVLINFQFYLKEPLQIILLNKGGLAFDGGLISAIGVSAWFLKRKRLAIWKVGDFVAPYIALGHGIGRIGCFLNGCCFGKPTGFVLGIRFPDDAVTRHPTQLYSALGLFVIFIILRFWYKHLHFEGQVFLSYLILYSIFRFFTDFFRGDIFPVSIGLTLSQLISVSILSIAVLILFFKRYSHH